MIEETLFKYLLVETGTVESAGHGKLHVGLQGVIAGRGINAVGVEALVKHKALENLFAVDTHTVILDRYRTKAEVTLCRIDNFAVLYKLVSEVVKSAVADLPKMSFIKRH